MVERHPEIDGFFSTDTVAVNALKYFLEHGKKIPEDVIVVGYDGIDAAKTSYPSLSYVEQPFDKLSEVIVDILLRKINGENITENTTVEDIRFVEGNSTRK